MKKRFSFSKLSILVATFGVLALCTTPATAQRSSGPPPKPVPRRATPPAQPAAPVQSQPIYNNQVKTQRGSGHQGHYTRAYCPPTYPGPDVPLPPQGSYYVPNPYYGYGYGQGYYNNGNFNSGYYNNGYYNNGYYNNGNHNNGYYSNGSNHGDFNQGQMNNFPPFQGY